MKKTLILFIAIVMASCASMTVFAQGQLTVKGEVTKIDVLSKSITIQPKDDAAVTIILDNAAQLKKVKVGQKAEVKYALKNGVNSGLKIRKIVDGCD